MPKAFLVGPLRTECPMMFQCRFKAHAAEPQSPDIAGPTCETHVNATSCHLATTLISGPRFFCLPGSGLSGPQSQPLKQDRSHTHKAGQACLQSTGLTGSGSATRERPRSMARSMAAKISRWSLDRVGPLSSWPAYPSHAMAPHAP